jgi:hypothetical protein
LLTLAFGQVPLPGTTSVSVPLAPAGTCRDCHGTYDMHAAWDTWAGSAMANSARNPLFLSALTEAEKDSPGFGDLCLRCHAPDAWLQGRCTPTDGSALTADDTGTTCAVCHRMEPSIWHRNGQFSLGEDRVYRGEYNDAMAPHQSQYGSWVEDPAFCAPCHDLRNPRVAWSGHEPMRFPEQSTFTEWAESAYATGDASERKTCQDCHLPESPGKADAQGPMRALRSSHDLSGGNQFLLSAIQFLEPGLGITTQLAAGQARAQAMLRQAAALDRVDTPRTLRRGERASVRMRVTNLCGHKLPTGYPEGRRVWLLVKAPEIGLSLGDLDPQSGDPVSSPAMYLTRQGLASTGPGHRLAINDTIFLDSRIPPKGLAVTATTAPVGKTYPEVTAGVLAHYDEVTITATVPCDLAGNAIGLSVSLMYQSVTKAYAYALAAENGADPRGARLKSAFDNADPGPFEIAHADITWAIDPSSSCAALDAGASDVISVVDAEPLDATAADASVPRTGKGCSCAEAKAADGSLCSSLLGVLFWCACSSHRFRPRSRSSAAVGRRA